MSITKLSSHVLDTSSGRPATALVLQLYKKRGEDWTLWHSSHTTSDGRVRFPFSEESMPPDVYKLRFNTEEYFRSRGLDTFYPYVEIVFRVEAGEHYHVPLLLSPYGFSTYRGS